MAKDRFIRSKPHVNVGTIRRLTRRGFTPLGAHQIAHGLVVTNPADRTRLAEMIAQTTREDGNVVQKVELVFKEVRIDY